MSKQTVEAGCGSSACGCAGGAVSEAPAQVAPTAAINGIALHAHGQRPFEDELRERAYAELLRQHAVAQGLLPRCDVSQAPELTDEDRQVLEAMVDAEVLATLPWPYLFHIVFGMTIFLLFPFSRLVHIWSGFASVGYLLRPYQVVRSRRLDVGKTTTRVSPAPHQPVHSGNRQAKH